MKLLPVLDKHGQVYDQNNTAQACCRLRLTLKYVPLSCFSFTKQAKPVVWTHLSELHFFLYFGGVWHVFWSLGIAVTRTRYGSAEKHALMRRQGLDQSLCYTPNNLRERVQMMRTNRNSPPPSWWSWSCGCWRRPCPGMCLSPSARSNSATCRAPFLVSSPPHLPVLNVKAGSKRYMRAPLFFASFQLVAFLFVPFLSPFRLRVPPTTGWFADLQLSREAGAHAGPSYPRCDVTL